jgi:hypothetical protein
MEEFFRRTKMKYKDLKSILMQPIRKIAVYAKDTDKEPCSTIEGKEISYGVEKQIEDYEVLTIWSEPFVEKRNFGGRNIEACVACGICVALLMSEQDSLVEELLKNEEIIYFESAEDMMDYFNTYDGQKFEDQEDMFNYIEGYYFRYKDEFYYINYDETKEKLKQGGLL